MILRARHIVPSSSPAIESAAIEIVGGRVRAAGPVREVAGPPEIDYGDAVILPAFVNAHTHLELSDLAGRVPPDCDFMGWLRRLMTHLATPPARDALEASVRRGVGESLSHGVLTIADITRYPHWTRGVLAASPLRSVSFGEVIAIGARRKFLSERLDSAARSDVVAETLRIGVSPHAPYTVEPEALRACAARARQSGLPLTVHLLESPDELEFCRSSAGPLAEYLREIGVWDDHIPASGCTPVELMDRTGILGPSTLLAHVNYATGDDMARIASSGASVVYCPRTHAAFGHAPHPFRQMLAAGINVCVGTDSLASNPSLSILDELRFLRRRDPTFSTDELLRMGTTRGAIALGWSDRTPFPRTGAEASFVVVPLAGRSRWDSIFDNDLPPIAVYNRGVALFSRHG